MAAINFPDSPSLNDFHVANGRRWQWNGTAWQRIPDPGAQGVQGAPGADGAQGAAGAQGTAGAQGSQGSAASASQFLTIGVRVGTATSIAVSSGTFAVVGRSGNVNISV